MSGNPFASLLWQLLPESVPERKPRDDDPKALEAGIVELRRKGYSYEQIMDRMHCTNEIVSDVLRKHGLNTEEALYRARLAMARRDEKRIDKLELIRSSGAPGAWSTVLLALRNMDDGTTVRDAIDAALEKVEVPGLGELEMKDCLSHETCERLMRELEAAATARLTGKLPQAHSIPDPKPVARP